MKHPGNLKKAAGATHKPKRVGRGAGSGHGGTAGKGSNGQKARSGTRVRIGFEGGQMPMNRRLPKFGFTNRFRIEYQEVNVGRLQELITQNRINASNTINAELLYSLGVLRKKNVPYKVLGNGEVKSAFTIIADKFTKSADEKIKAAGGSIAIKSIKEGSIEDSSTSVNTVEITNAESNVADSSETTVEESKIAGGEETTNG